MLLTGTQAALIAWGIGGACMVAGLAGAVWFFRDDRRLPATGCAMLALAGLVLANSRQANGTRVLLIEDAGRAPRLTDLRVYGTVVRPLGNGTPAHLRWLKPRQIIVNDTAHELILHTVLYGYGLSSKQPVRPYSVVELDRLLDYYGPTDRPPASVEGYGGPRYWLTW